MDTISGQTRNLVGEKQKKKTNNLHNKKLCPMQLLETYGWGNVYKNGPMIFTTQWPLNIHWFLQSFIARERNVQKLNKSSEKKISRKKGLL